MSWKTFHRRRATVLANAKLERLRRFCGSVVAMNVTGAVFGFLALGKCSNERTWDAVMLQRLSLVAEVIANALARARIEAELSVNAVKHAQADRVDLTLNADL